MLTLDQVARYVPGLRPIPAEHGTRTEFNGPCPFCGGTNRFYLFEKGGKVRWWCREAREFHRMTNLSREFGSIWFGDNLIYLLTGSRPDTGFKPDPNYHFHRLADTPQAFVPEPPSWTKMVEDVKIDMGEVETYARNIGPAIEYFGQYGISEATLREHKIGYAVHPKHTRVPEGWVIPNISIGPGDQRALRGVQIRRNDDACLMEIAGWSDSRIDIAIRKIEAKWAKDVIEGKRPADATPFATHQDIIEDQWPKYSSLSTSQNGVWGDDIVTLPGLERRGQDLPYCFVVESVKCVLALREDGWPAVAYKPRSDWNAWLPRVFGRVRVVYIIADRDEGWQNAGKGLETARQVKSHIDSGGLSLAHILLPPSPHKQVSDLVKAEGFDALSDWITAQTYGLTRILPSKREAINV